LQLSSRPLHTSVRIDALTRLTSAGKSWLGAFTGM